MDWKIIAAVFGVLFAASWAVIIPVCRNFWMAILKARQDYIDFMKDGVLTDTERIHFADDIIQIVINASSIFQFVVNLVGAISSVIPKAVGKRAKKNKVTTS